MKGKNVGHAKLSGERSAGQEIIAVEEAPAREAGEIIEDDGESFTKIVAYLENLKVI